MGAGHVPKLRILGDVDIFVVTEGSVDFKLRSEIYRVLSERLRKPITLIAVSRGDLAKEDLELTPLLINKLISWPML